MTHSQRNISCNIGGKTVPPNSVPKTNSKWHSQHISSGKRGGLKKLKNSASNISLANKCKNCRKLQKELYQVESKCTHLALENNKLKNNIRLLKQNSINSAGNNNAVNPTSCIFLQVV